MESACSISHIYADDIHPSSDFFLQVYHSDIKVKKPFLQGRPNHDKFRRQAVFNFSDKSKARLSEVCRNSGHWVRSQFCLTYHLFWPSSGLDCKKQLNRFITALNRHPGISYLGCDLHYLWVLEFQGRRAPHFHLFTDLLTDPEWQGVPFVLPINKDDLATIWVVQVQGLHFPGAQSTLDFHRHEKNFFPWRMASGKYLVKEYIEKSLQKDVPENFQNVGRFWGNSRNMKPQFYILDPKETHDNADPLFAGLLRRAIRSITKYRNKCSDSQAKHVKGLLQQRLQDLRSKNSVSPESLTEAEKRFSSIRARCSRKKNDRAKVRSYTLLLATPLLFQFLDSFNQLGRYWTGQIPF